MDSNAEEQAVILTFISDREDLSDDEVGRISTLEDLLYSKALEFGEYDGNEIGGGRYTLYFYSPNAEGLARALMDVLAEQQLPTRAEITTRYGPPGSRQTIIEVGSK
ncbi:MAG: hypothetical protein H7039_19555 [Bryobacteraceae bacterium]|nr:hypothetical protein [Bryobacteraceae bacterium]